MYTYVGMVCENYIISNLIVLINIWKLLLCFFRTLIFRYYAFERICLRKPQLDKICCIKLNLQNLQKTLQNLFCEALVRTARKGSMHILKELDFSNIIFKKFSAPTAVFVDF